VRRALFSCAIGLASIIGCGDDVTPMDAGDSGTDADTGVDAAPDAWAPSTPAMAALPVLTPCPAGWHEAAGDDGAPTICEPYGETGFADCPLTEAHFPGTPGCAAITSPCPADGWPADVPEADVVYVRSDAAPGGDGSRAAPHRTIAEALVDVVDGGAIALAPGRYGPAVVNRDVALRGACAEVVFSSPDAVPALTFERATAVIDNIRFSGASNGLFVVDTTLTASRLVIDDLNSMGMNLTNGVLNASRIRIHDAGETGVFVATRGQLTASELAFTGAIRTATRSVGGEALFTDVVVSIVENDPDVYVGSSGAAATFERLAVAGDGTVLLLDTTTLTLRDSAIRGTPTRETTFSSSMVAFDASRIVLERTSLDRIWGFAAAAAQVGSELVATDVVIRGTADGAIEHGFELGEGASGTFNRVFVGGARAIGVLATDEGTTLIAEDLVVQDTRPSAGGLLGRALQIQIGAHFIGRRVHVAGSHEVAVVAGAGDARIELVDAIIELTQERGCAAAGCAAAGIGLGAYVSGQISIDRFRIAGNALAGVQLALEGEIDMRDGVVSDNPVGVNVQIPDYDISRLTERVVFRDNGINLDSDELPLPAATAR